MQHTLRQKLANPCTFRSCPKPERKYHHTTITGFTTTNIDWQQKLEAMHSTQGR